MTKRILNTIEDLVASFMYYDRRGDEEFGLKELEEAKKHITPEELAEKFLQELKEVW
tara:strand:- start:924 stop:1094 length:171 start_codon:yes stop_codon:yes gene_type:complete